MYKRTIEMKPHYYIPRCFYVLAGYKGLQKGLAIGWLGKMVIIIKPITDRD